MNKKVLLIVYNYPIYDNRGIFVTREISVSHGVDLVTGKNIILPQLPPDMLGGEFDIESGEWYLYE